jgi:hypothetical protein
MFRTLNCALTLAGAYLLAGAAGAEAPAASDCPAGPVAVYFASGATTATPQVATLIGRIGDAAASCEADRIDLVAHIDPGVDGDGAAALALERLKLMMKDLVARGLPVERIRFAAQAADEDAPIAGFSQVDVMFRKAEDVQPTRNPAIRDNAI